MPVSHNQCLMSWVWSCILYSQTCRFSRYGPVIDTGRDFDLNTSRYILYGRRTAGEDTDQARSQDFEREVLFLRRGAPPKFFS